MEFMLIMLDERGRDIPKEWAEAMFPRMAEFAMGLAKEGKVTGGSPLHPESEGSRVRAADGKVTVTDGPFTETKEIITGYFVVQADSRAEALEIAKRCPHAEIGIVEVREIIPMGSM
jgi:hypothetical protein